MRRALALAFVLLIASFSTVAANEASEDQFAQWLKQDDCEYFEETDKYLCFGFRSYWQEFGGLEIFGYPITNEIIEDGRTVQYFERARFEWHPGAWPERHDVLQGRLGAELTADMAGQGAFARAEEQDDCIYYEQTGHNVCGEFADRWEMSGGLAVFGYPISEAFEEDGVTVQYFERARFEHQPGVWPERHDVLLGLVGVEALAQGEQPEPPTEPEPPVEPEPTVEVIAEELTQPRGVTATSDGVYVAEAGVGGDGACTTSAEGNEVCFGLSGSVTRVTDAGVERIAEGLPSLGAPEADSSGPHDVAFDSEGNMYAVIGLGAHPDARADLGENGNLLATLVRIEDDGELTVIADLGEYEATVNPDGSEVPDTNPYALTMDGDDFIVADAGGNSLLRVTMDGEISTIASFPARMVEPPPFIDAPQVPMESVPTNVVVGPDGAYYVVELTGFPFEVGGARVYRVTTDGEVTVYADGFTNLSDLAFDSEGNLYVLEMLSGGLLNADPEDPSTLAGRIVRIDSDGTQTELAVPNIAFATGLAIGENDELYVANMSVTPMAQLLRIDLP